MDFSAAKVVVVGLGKSGVAAAGLLNRLGARVVATDARDKEEIVALAPLRAEGTQIILGEHPLEILTHAALVVVSPGVPRTIPFLQEARRRGIEVWSEVELAYRLSPAPIIAITGANGKTTTTAWLGEMLKAGGKRVMVAGNIGTPLTAVIEKVTAAHLLVVEVSSFQLESTREFRPHMAALLNLTPDHLDRHGSFAAYAAAKGRIFANQDSTDYCILNADDEEVGKLGERLQGQVYPFSSRRELTQGAFIKDGSLVIRAGGKLHRLCSAGELALPGGHNRENALAAALMAYLSGVDPQVIAAVLKNFAGVAHRCETVAEIDGVRFVNDSKGTNPESTMRALEAFGQPIILIAGGRAKGSDFGQLAKAVKERVKRVILLGEAAPLLQRALSAVGYRSVLPVASLKDAVREAFSEAVPGDCILLSPACASWDMFTSFEERGEVFKEAVAQLGGGTDEKKV